MFALDSLLKKLRNIVFISRIIFLEFEEKLTYLLLLIYAKLIRKYSHFLFVAPKTTLLAKHPNIRSVDFLRKVMSAELLAIFKVNSIVFHFNQSSHPSNTFERYNILKLNSNTLIAIFETSSNFMNLFPFCLKNYKAVMFFIHSWTLQFLFYIKFFVFNFDIKFKQNKIGCFYDIRPHSFLSIKFENF